MAEGGEGCDISVVENGEIMSLTASLAIERLAQGAARLADRQEHPPFALLDHWMACAEGLERLGPPTKAATVQMAIQRHVLHLGVPQLAIEGRSVEWFAWPEDVRAKAELIVAEWPPATESPLRQARRVLNARISSTDQKVSFGPGVVSDADLKKRGAVRRPPSRFIVYVDDYPVVGPSWCQFAEELDQSDAAFKVALQRALAEGRIICVEELAHGHRLIPPGQAGQLSQSSRTNPVTCMFSQFLPENCFEEPKATAPHKSQSELVRVKAEAARWMNDAGRKLKLRGKRASKQQFCEIMAERFGLSDKAASEVWAKRTFEDTDRPGAIRDNSKVSLNDLRALN